MEKTDKKSFRLEIWDWVAFAVFFAALLIWTRVIHFKYQHFGYFDWDLAFFSQATWNLLHGSQYSSLFDINLFGNHSNFFVFLILPLFAVFPHPLTLVSLKVISYLLGALILYWLTKQKLNGILAVIVMLLYIVYPPNIFSILYEFDFESLAPVFLFLLYYFFCKEKFIPFFVAAIILITVKENMPLIIVAFGVYSLFIKGKNKLLWGIVPIFLGTAAFFLLSTIIIPSFQASGAHLYLSHYSHLGNSVGEIIKALVTNPLKITESLFTPDVLNLLYELFIPLLFMPIFGIHILFFPLPILLQHVLSSVSQEHTIYYQYTITIAPFIFIALTHSLEVLQKHSKRLVLLFAMFLMLLFSCLSFVRHISSIVFRVYPHSDNLDSVRWDMIQRIPKGAGVIATFDFLAELSTRKHLYAFHKIYSPQYQETKQPFLLPDHVSHAIIDLSDLWLSVERQKNKRAVDLRVGEFFNSNGWQIEYKNHQLILLKRRPLNQ